MKIFCFILIIPEWVRNLLTIVIIIKNDKLWLIWPFKQVKIFSDWLKIIMEKFVTVYSYQVEFSYFQLAYLNHPLYVYWRNMAYKLTKMLYN